MLRVKDYIYELYLKKSWIILIADRNHVSVKYVES